MADSPAPYGGIAMAEQVGNTVGTGQLVQLRIPLDQAADAFSRPDERGRTPIVVVPLTPSRVQTELLLIGGAAILIGLVAMIVFGWLGLGGLVLLAGLVVAV